MTRIEEALIRLESALAGAGARWALVGGLAVSARAEPRTTRDVDVAVAVGHDGEAELLIRELAALGFRVGEQLEQEAVGRLASVRMAVPGQGDEGVVVDLLFASSGIEQEVVRAAEPLPLLPGAAIPVATVAHLLALKVLAGRPLDLEDGRRLLERATTLDRQRAREALVLIEKRGFHRNKDLLTELARLESGGEPGRQGYPGGNR